MKSFVPDFFSKSCLFPSNDDYGALGVDPRFNIEKALLFARVERIFIYVGIFAIVLGSIMSIWTKLDPEFQNLHKPASNVNDHEMSRIASSSDPVINPSNEVSEDQLEKDQCSVDTILHVLVHI